MENLLDQGTGSRDTRSILVDIEAAIKMRDTSPLNVNQFIDNRLPTIVFLNQSVIDRTQSISGQWLTLLSTAVNFFLKFSKHRLTEERAPDIFQRMVEDSQLYSAVICRFQQVLGQQTLVYCRS